jgi:hypothetical protein
VIVTVTFDSPIDPSTALLSVAWYAGAPGVPCTGGTTAVVSLMPPTSYDPVTFAASYAVTGLKKNKCHVAVVGGGVQNPCGVAMGAPKTWTFTAANKSLEITGWGP